ncbi:MAG: hypothetical protein KF709_02735 [Gemmatimonadaceae bacterium]|nr:hypothetical protein [Gemmatimonadaceae bacterium]
MASAPALPPKCASCGKSQLKTFNPRNPSEQWSGCTCPPADWRAKCARRHPCEQYCGSCLPREAHESRSWQVDALIQQWMKDAVGAEIDAVGNAALWLRRADSTEAIDRASESLARAIFTLAEKAHDAGLSLSQATAPAADALQVTTEADLLQVAARSADRRLKHIGRTYTSFEICVEGEHATLPEALAALSTQGEGSRE